MKKLRLLTLLLGLSGLIGLCYSLFAASASEEQRKYILIAWSVFPPIFFACIFRYFRHEFSKDGIEDSKTFYFLIRNAWIGILVALIIEYFKP